MRAEGVDRDLGRSEWWEEAGLMPAVNEAQEASVGMS